METSSVRARSAWLRSRWARRAALAAVAILVLALAAWAFARIGLGGVTHALISVEPGWALLSFGTMAASMIFRAEAWYAILRSALPGEVVRRGDVIRATMIGVFMSAILPGRIGEAGRAIVLSRRLGRVSSYLPVVIGTLFSQTLLNVAGLLAVALIAIGSDPALDVHRGALALVAVVPAVLVGVVLSAPWLAERVPARQPRLRRALTAVARRLAELRGGLRVFRRASTALHAAAAQLTAWALQLLSLYVLILAFRLHPGAGIAAAAAVLTAVNIAGILPVTPSNLGVFQAACVVVLAGFDIGTEAALAYGIALQAIEVAVAVTLGLPALAMERLSFADLRGRAEELPDEPDAPPPGSAVADDLPPSPSAWLTPPATRAARRPRSAPSRRAGSRRSRRAARPAPCR